MKSANEAAEVYALGTGIHPDVSPASYDRIRRDFVSGFHEGVRACIEELRGEGYLIVPSDDPTDGRLVADWLEKRMGERG